MSLERRPGEFDIESTRNDAGPSVSKGASSELGEKLFINYRRADTGKFLDDLLVVLNQLMSPGLVFVDQDITSPEDWQERLQEEVQSARAVFVLIGPDWEKCKSGAIFRRKDVVRLEIEWALAASCFVVPIFVDRQDTPEPEGFPQSIHGLLAPQGIRLESLLDRADKAKLAALLAKVGFEVSSEYRGFATAAGAVGAYEDIERYVSNALSRDASSSSPAAPTPTDSDWWWKGLLTVLFWLGAWIGYQEWKLTPESREAALRVGQHFPGDFVRRNAQPILDKWDELFSSEVQSKIDWNHLLGRGVDVESSAANLLARVAEHPPVEELGQIYFALELVTGSPPDRDSFFALAGRPIANVPEIEWVHVPAGTFVMGGLATVSPGADYPWAHTIAVKEFLMAKTEVTNAQYRAFDPSHEAWPIARGSAAEIDDHPVVMVSWLEASLYCVWIGGRLPTEAEWEYACRGGTTTRFGFGDAIVEGQVNCLFEEELPPPVAGVFLEGTVAVGSLPPNAFGLHEMHGNVSEYCQDHWHAAGEPCRPLDGSAWIGEESGLRVVRGGSWSNRPKYCDSAVRRSAEALGGQSDRARRRLAEPTGWAVGFGFRPVFTIE